MTRHLLVVFLTFLALVSSSVAESSVPNCEVITVGGDTYLLNDTNTGAPNNAPLGYHACIIIDASDVILDCDGYDIVDDGFWADTIGILVNESATNVTVQNCPNVSYYDAGVVVYNTTDVLVQNVKTYDNEWIGFGVAYSTYVEFLNNEAYNASVGFALNESSHNTLTNNIAYYHTNAAFSISAQEKPPLPPPIITKSNNTLIGNDGSHTKGIGFAISYDSNNTLIGNTAYNNSEYGFHLESTSNNILTSNVADNNKKSGFHITTKGGDFTNNTLTDNNATNNGGSGFSIYRDKNNTLTGNYAFNNSKYGFYLQETANNILIKNIADLNFGTNFYIEARRRGTNNTLIENNASSSRKEDGFAIDSDWNNTLIGNIAYNNSMNGFYLRDTRYNELTENLAYENGQGFELDSTDNNTLTDNIAYDNGKTGFYDGHSSYNVYEGNEAYNHAKGNGFYIITKIAWFTENLAYDNAQSGFMVDGSSNVYMEENTANGNNVGIFLIDSNNTTILKGHYYDNIIDFNNSFDPLTVGGYAKTNLTEVFFDNPTGNFNSYTRLSVDNKIVVGAVQYSIDHATKPDDFPHPDLISFENKYVEIEKYSIAGPDALFTWHWYDYESALYNENELQLWAYRKGPGWVLINDTPDADANTFTMKVNSSDPLSVFAILHNGTKKPVDDDDDKDKDRLSASLIPSCEGNIVKVTSSGDPVEEAEVLITNSYILISGKTNDSGEFMFDLCGEKVTAHVNKDHYLPDTVTETLFDCEQCEEVECETSEDCEDYEECIGNECVPLECVCGYPENNECVYYDCCSDGDCPQGQLCQFHECVDEFECTTDTDCEGTEYCEIPVGAAGGNCEPVTGECGYVDEENHVWVQYECGDEEECPTCPPTTLCEDHICVSTGLECDVAGIVGTQTFCKGFLDGLPCPNCDYVITDPTGKAYTGKTDAFGSIVVPFDVEGTYKVALIKDGEVVAEKEIYATPKSQPAEGEKPSEFSDAEKILWSLVLLALLIALFFYLRRTKTRRKKK